MCIYIYKCTCQPLRPKKCVLVVQWCLHHFELCCLDLHVDIYREHHPHACDLTKTCFPSRAAFRREILGVGHTGILKPDQAVRRYCTIFDSGLLVLSVLPNYGTTVSEYGISIEQRWSRCCMSSGRR